MFKFLLLMVSPYCFSFLSSLPASVAHAVAVRVEVAAAAPPVGLVPEERLWRYLSHLWMCVCVSWEQGQSLAHECVLFTLWLARPLLTMDLLPAVLWPIRIAKAVKLSDRCQARRSSLACRQKRRGGKTGFLDASRVVSWQWIPRGQMAVYPQVLLSQGWVSS